MDRAGANDNEDSIIVSSQNPSRIVAGRSNGLLGDRSGDDLMAKQGRLDEGVILK